MTAIEIAAQPARERAPAKPRAPLFAPLLAAWRRYREQRRTLELLRRLDARTLTDMGFEPAEIYGSRAGTIGEIHGEAWKGLEH